MDPEISTQPLHGVVLCCTSVPVDVKTDIAKKVAELGGQYTSDLTQEVTHLVVGDYNTPKYRHVAYERPDIRPVCIGWVDAVLDCWTRDVPIDLPALERQWTLRTLESHGGMPAGPDGEPIDRGRLLCSLTGFEEDERKRIIAAIVDNGGVYSGDLTRDVTHLIVCRPEGNKYNAAVHWGIRTVAPEWLHDSIARGMILDEAKYDPRLPPEVRGRDACLVRTPAECAAILGKRQRETAAAAAANSSASQLGLRKLRKTASRKLAVQRDSLWGDILGKPTEPDDTASTASTARSETLSAKLAELARKTAQQPSPQPQSDAQPQLQPQPEAQPQIQPPPPADMLAASIFCIHGFSSTRKHVLINAIATMGGTVAPSLTAMAALAERRRASNAHVTQHVIVPQVTLSADLPAVPDGVVLVTEFFVEKCLHKKQYVLPATTQQADASVVGRPFPVFPIAGFDQLTVCTAGFTGVDLHQVDKAVRQLGARYQERFTAHCSVLIVTALTAVRKQKLELALAWKVPVVDAKWLWTCIATGIRKPLDAYLFPQLRQAASLQAGQRDKQPGKQPEQPQPTETEALTVPTLVMTAEDRGEEEKEKETARKESPAPRKLGRVVSEIADSTTESDSDNDIEAAIRESRRDKAPQPETRPEAHPDPEAAQPDHPHPLRRSATTAVTAHKHARLSRVASDGIAGLPVLPRPPKPIGVSLDELMRDGGVDKKADARYRARLSRSASAASAPAMAAAGLAPSASAGDELPSQPPTQVQVQYLDPEADMYRARLMQKILGVSEEEVAKETSKEPKENGAGSSISGKDSRPMRRSSRLR